MGLRVCLVPSKKPSKNEILLMICQVYYENENKSSDIDCLIENTTVVELLQRSLLSKSQQVFYCRVVPKNNVREEAQVSTDDRSFEIIRRCNT